MLVSYLVAQFTDDIKTTHGLYGKAFVSSYIAAYEALLDVKRSFQGGPFLVFRSKTIRNVWRKKRKDELIFPYIITSGTLICSVQHDLVENLSNSRAFSFETLVIGYGCKSIVLTLVVSAVV